MVEPPSYGGDTNQIKCPSRDTVNEPSTLRDKYNVGGLMIRVVSFSIVLFYLQAFAGKRLFAPRQSWDNNQSKQPAVPDLNPGPYNTICHQVPALGPRKSGAVSPMSLRKGDDVDGVHSTML